MYAYCFLREKSSLHIIFTSINNQKSTLNTHHFHQYKRTTTYLSQHAYQTLHVYLKHQSMSFSFRLKSFQTKPINFCLLFFIWCFIARNWRPAFGWKRLWHSSKLITASLPSNETSISLKTFWSSMERMRWVLKLASLQ